MPPDQPTEPANRLLSKQDVAARLHVSVRTVERLASSGDIPTVRVVGSTRFDPRDVEAYIDRQRGASQ